MKKNYIIIIILILTLIGVLGYNYAYKSHRNISEEDVEQILSSKECIALFKANESPDILNSTIIVKGKIEGIEESGILIDSKVYATFNKLPDDITVGQRIEVKGRCIGYDDLFEIVKLDQCTIINN